LLSFCLDLGPPEHRPVVRDVRVRQLDKVEQYVDADQGPGDRGAGGRPAAEHRACPADAAVPLPHALDALLANRG